MYEMSYRDRNTKIYVGNISSSTSKEDLEYEFGYYGRLVSVWVAKNPPGFSYIEFEDARDAEDAIKGLDGRELNGRRMRVEQSHSTPRGREGRLGSAGRRPFHPSDRCYNCGESGHYAYDCDLYNRRKQRSRRSRSRSPRPRRRSYTRSRSPRRRRRSPSYSRSRSRSRRRSYSRSRSRSSHSRSRSRTKKSRSRSPRREDSSRSASRSRSH